MKDIIIKSSTLMLFVSLLVGFVSYRSGYWGGTKSSYPVSPNGSALNNQVDTLPNVKIDDKQILPSSKVLILKEHSTPQNDTNNQTKTQAQTQTQTQTKKDTNATLKTNPFMYSSKSGAIFELKDLEIPSIDTTKQDSLK